MTVVALKWMETVHFWIVSTSATSGTRHSCYSFRISRGVSSHYVHVPPFSAMAHCAFLAFSSVISATTAIFSALVLVENSLGRDCWCTAEFQRLQSIPTFSVRSSAAPKLHLLVICEMTTTKSLTGSACSWLHENLYDLYAACTLHGSPFTKALSTNDVQCLSLAPRRAGHISCRP